MKNNTLSRSSSALRAIRRCKLALAALAAVALLIYVAPLAATAVIGKENLRAWTQAELSRALARDVRVEGPVRITMLPWLGLRAGMVSVPAHEGFGPEPLLQVESVSVELDLLALATGKVTIGAVKMRAPTLHMVRNAAGQASWLGGPSDGQGSGQGQAPFSLDSLPQGVTLAGASLSFEDKRTGQVLTARQINIKTGSGKRFNFSLSCLLGLKRPRLEFELHATGQASLSTGLEYLFIHQANVGGVLSLPGVALPTGGGQAAPVQAHVEGVLTVNSQAQALELAGFSLKGLGAEVAGAVNVAGLGDAVPTMVASLTAKGQRGGQWAKALGLGMVKQPPVESDKTPSYRPSPTGADELSLGGEFSAGPDGWRVENLVLTDGQGLLKGWASHLADRLAFGLSAKGFDSTAWESPGEGPLMPLLDLLGPQTGVDGRFAGEDLRLFGQLMTDVSLTARAEQGVLRVYPFTVRTPEALVSADVRLQHGAPSKAFSVGAQLCPLPGEQDAKHTPIKLADAHVAGEIGPQGVVGKVSMNVGEAPPQWRWPDLSADLEALWKQLGQVSAKGALRIGPTGGQGPPLWEASELEVKTSHFHLSGRLARREAGFEADLACDRVDLEKVSALLALGEKQSEGAFPAIEGRVAVKRSAAFGLEFDDVVVAGALGPHALKLTTIGAAVGGGKLSGSLDMEDRDGKRQLAATFAAAGVQAHALSALWPAMPKLTGALDGRGGVEGSARAGQPLWRGLRGQAEFSVGAGSVAMPGEGGRAGAPWPFSRAGLNLKWSVRPAATGAEQAREAALADIAGTFTLDTLGMLKQARMELHGQAGLDQAGRALWYRQPKLEGSLGLSLPFARPGVVAQCQWLGKFDTDFEKGQFTFSDVDLRLGGVACKARVSGHTVQGVFGLSGALEAPEFNPREVAPRLGFAVPERAAPDVWRKARLSAEIGGTARELRLANIRAWLDDSYISGQALLGDKAQLDLAVDIANLDRLAPEPPAAEAARRPDEPLPMDALRNLNLDAKIRVTRMVRDRLAWDNMTLTLAAHGGRFTLRQQSPGFYGGSYMMEFTGDARGAELRCGIDLRIAAAMAAPLLKDLGDVGSLSRGLLDFNLNVETQGASDKGLRRKASGQARFVVSDGRLVLRESSSKGSQAPVSQPMTDREPIAPPPPPASHEAVPFSRISAAFAIRDGVAVTRDLLLAGSELSARGEGFVNLPEELIDLALTAQVKDVGEVPVRIRGPLYDPKLEIDRSKVLSDKIVNLFMGVISLPANIFDRVRRF